MLEYRENKISTTSNKYVIIWYFLRLTAPLIHYLLSRFSALFLANYLPLSFTHLRHLTNKANRHFTVYFFSDSFH